MSVCEPTSRKLLVRTAWGPPGLATAADGTRGQVETGDKRGLWAPAATEETGTWSCRVSQLGPTWSLDAFLQGEEENELLH